MVAGSASLRRIISPDFEVVRDYISNKFEHTTHKVLAAPLKVDHETIIILLRALYESHRNQPW